MRSDIAVIGGSIAGLTVAALLRDAGYEVSVYERASQPLSGLGTGIVAQPELVRYLLERTPTTLDEISLAAHHIKYLRADTGATLGEVEGDWRFTSYNALYDRLLDSLGPRNCHFSHQFVGLNQDDKSVRLAFAGGKWLSAEMVVFADGGMSEGRRQLLGVESRYAGYVSWRGIVEEDDIGLDTLARFRDSFTYGLLDDGHLIAYPIPVFDADGNRRRALNFQWYWNVQEGTALDRLMTDRYGKRRSTTVNHDALHEEVLTEFRGQCEARLRGPFAELLEAAREPFVTIIADADVERMRVGRAVLIGDAAITPRPHAAAGAAKAAADAWAFVDAMTATDQTGRMLEEWEKSQLALGRAYLTKVRRMAGVLQHGGPFIPGDPDNKFGLPNG